MVPACERLLPQNHPRPWVETQSCLIELGGYLHLRAQLDQPPATSEALRRICRRNPLWKIIENLRLPAVLRPFHLLGEFHSGRSRCDRWLKSEALSAQKRGLSRTFVVAVELKVVGYFTLTAGKVRAAAEGCKTGIEPPPIPAAILQWLAIDKSWQGLGLGYSLLWDALRRIDQAADLLGMRCALAESRRGFVRGFLAAHGFEPALGDGKTMMLRLCDLRRAQDEIEQIALRCEDFAAEKAFYEPLRLRYLNKTQLT